MQIPTQHSIKLTNIFLFVPILLVALLLVPSIVQLLTTDMPAVELEAYYRDPISTIGQLTNLDSPFVGIYSQLGAMLWFSGATIGLFTAYIVYSINKQTALMVMSLALMGLMLGADDLLLIHERLAPQFLHIGERYVILSYILLAFAIVWVLGRQIWEYDKFFLIVACIFLAGSVGIDFVEESFDHIWGEAAQGILEDSMKLLGIAAYWTGIFKISSRIIKDTFIAQYKVSSE